MKIISGKVSEAGSETILQDLQPGQTFIFSDDINCTQKGKDDDFLSISLDFIWIRGKEYAKKRNKFRIFNPGDGDSYFAVGEVIVIPLDSQLVVDLQDINPEENTNEDEEDSLDEDEDEEEDESCVICRKQTKKPKRTKK